MSSRQAPADDRGPAATASTLELTEPRFVHFLELVPGWHDAPHSTDAGFFRWLSTYIGGPPGHLHEYPRPAWSAATA